MNICIYGAASDSIDNEYIKAGEELGVEMAKRGHSLVYGAGATGLMGAVARGVDSLDGKIIGVVPWFFTGENTLYEECDTMTRTDTMHQRKKIMEDTSDAFIVTPGGIGTYDEFFELITLKQLARHNKPVVIFNVKGYFKPLVDLLEHAINNGFLSSQSRELYHVSSNIEDIFNYFDNYVPIDHKLPEIQKFKDK